MAGLIVELLISWLLLWLFFKQSLLALGIAPTKKRIAGFFVGFVVSAGCCTIYYLFFALPAGNRWTLNNEFTGQQLLSASWWTLKSVLYEELIFRGALLYILLKKTGVRTACLISAAAFGIYHWFTLGVLGNYAQMIFVFVLTGVWGAMFAFAFARTKSLYLPLGLHFGWNLVNSVIFSEGTLGNQLLIMNDGQKLGSFLAITVFLFQVLAVPAITFWYLKWQSRSQSRLHPAELKAMA